MKRQSSGQVTQQPCVSCGGRGSSTCTACGGVGHTVISKSRIRYDRTVEFYQDRVPCTACFGSGRITCVFCKGLGAVLQSDTAAALPTPDGDAYDTGAVEGEPPNVFQFPPYEFVRHPTRQEIWACWQYNPGNCLDIGLTLSSSMRIELAGHQTDTWLDIQDDAGNAVPLSILIGSTGGLSGRWL